MGVVDFNKVVAWSRANCFHDGKSHHLCATYVKKAFLAGGCTYVTGDGWSNQKWCQTNNFVCIGDFEPVGHNPRKGMQFPPGYKQQVGDVCLIKRGKEYGHMCYAMGPGINDWVSDYFQIYPPQQNGTGPYCYASGIDRVQFWRHSSVLNGAPAVTTAPVSEYTSANNIVSGDMSQQNVVVGGTPVDKGTVSQKDILSKGENREKMSGRILGSHIIQS